MTNSDDNYWQDLRQRIADSKKNLPRISDNNSDANIISTSKGEKPNPFHGPISQPQRDTPVKLNNLSSLHDWTNKQSNEYNNRPHIPSPQGDSYRHYLNRAQPNQENQNSGNNSGETKSEQPETNQNNPEINRQNSNGEPNQPLDTNNQNDNIKDNLQGNYGQNSEIPRIVQTDSPGDFTPFLKA